MLAVELPRESDGVIESAQRLFAGRDGRIALTLVLAVTAALEASLYTPDMPDFPFEETSHDPAGTVILNVLAVLPLLATWRFPFLGAAAVSFFSFVILGSSETPVTLSALGVLLYAIGHLVAQRGVLWAAPFVFLFFVHAIVPFDGGRVDLASIGPFLLVIAAVLAGESYRQRTEAVTALDETQAAMAESVREQTAMEERAAIARELHDIVAHHLSMIAVQSETARLTSPKLSADARGRFEAIAATARDALTETRRLLGVLREDVDGDAERAPQPGLDQLAELVDTARDAGSNIRLILQGKVVPLPAGIDLAAYRIVQEALTNARRHAPGADVDVEVTYGEGVATPSRSRPRAWSCRGDADRPRNRRHARPCDDRRRHVLLRRGGRWRIRGRRRAPHERGGRVIRTLVADDQEVVREAFVALLGTQDDMTVVARAADGAEAVKLSAEHGPDVVLMDVRMPVMDGIEATREIAAADADGGPRILILTTFDLDDYVYDALQAGASGFLLKDVPAETLFEAVRVIAGGEALLAPTITRRLIAEFARTAPSAGSSRKRSRTLTPRETEILGLVAEGLSNSEIASRLVLSDETVKTHVSHVLRKLGLRDRAQAVVVAYESGLVVPRG